MDEVARRPLRDAHYRTGVTIEATQLDNFSLVSASLVGNMREYQALSDRQPRGTAVMVLPSSTSPLRRVYAAVARVLRENGKNVKLYSAA